MKRLFWCCLESNGNNKHDRYAIVDKRDATPENFHIWIIKIKTELKLKYNSDSVMINGGII